MLRLIYGRDAAASAGGKGSMVAMITMAAPQAGQMSAGLCFWLRARVRQGVHRSTPQYQLHQADQFFAASMEKTIGPCPAQSSWQHIVQKQGEKGLGRDGSGPIFPAFGMAVAERDHAVLAVEDILFPDDAPVQVTAQIDKGLLAVAHVLAVNHPLFGAIGGNRQLVFDQGLEEFCPEHLGHGLVAEEIFPGFFLQQSCF